MNEELRYANTYYWSFHVSQVDFGPDLEDLIRHAHTRADQEQGTVGEFHQWVDDRWVYVHDNEIRRIESIIDAENRALYDQINARGATCPYAIWVQGPGGVWGHWDDRATVEGAEALLDDLAPLHAVYRTDGMRPR